MCLLLVGFAQWCSQGIRVVKKSSEPQNEEEELDRDFDATDGAAVANSSLIESETTGPGRRRRRRRCSKWTPKRNRYAGSKSPAVAYMIAHAHEKTQLESFSRTSDVKWDSWWYSYVTRIEMDFKGNEVRRQCSCGDCDGYFNWAKRHLFSVTRCSHPSGKWKAAFTVHKSAADHTYTFSTWSGQEFSRIDTKTEEFGVSASVAAGPFSTSASYSYIASTQTIQTWSSGRNISHAWFVPRGESAVVWNYVLAAKCFNDVGMFMEEVTFGTNIFHGTQDSRPPTCNPNTPGDCR